MDNSQLFPYPVWHGGSEIQQQQQPLHSAPTTDLFTAFYFSAPPLEESRTAMPSFPTDLFPGVSQCTLWDISLASPFPHPAQAATGAPEQPVLQHWDALISSLPPPLIRPPSAGSDFSSDYGIGVLMDGFCDDISSSRISSVPPSNDDGWSSRLGGPFHSLVVSVEIKSWDPNKKNDYSFNNSASTGSHTDPAAEAPDIDAQLSWEWKPSDLKWLDSGVSSEVIEFPQGVKITNKNTIFALHRVKGCPSQFPFYHQRTAFLVDFTDMDHVDPEKTVDSILHDQDDHSWGSSSGTCNQVDAHIPGSFFGLDSDVKIACRRASPKCGGVSACESLDPTFLSEERRKLDPEPSRKLAAAMCRTREIQGSTEVGRTLAFHHSLQNWHCNGFRMDGTRCDGTLSLRKLSAPFNNKNHILLCSKRDTPLIPNSFHSQTRILDEVPEALFVKVMRGECIIDANDTQGTCSRVVSGRTGQKGRAVCPFTHHKNGVAYVAKIQRVTCNAKMHIFCPWEDRHPDLARMALVIPLPESGHTHPPPPSNKCTHTIAEWYRECVRKIGLSATVSKVENAQSTKDLLNGLTPSLFHPGLISRDTKTRLIKDVKTEFNDGTSSEANTRQQVAAYLAEQEVRGDEDRFLQTSMSLRTLDCDTTFKPVAGKMNVYEINGWLVAINEEVTVMRVWMEVHDRLAFKAVWEEIQRLVLKLTRKQLKFKGLHKGGKILGLNSNMEAAPLLGFADAFVATVDREDVKSVVATDPQELLSFVLRICYAHFNRGIPKLSHLSAEVRQRLFNLKYLRTVEEVESFKAWILTVIDPQGVLKKWWEHKFMHRWLLRGIIQCLSNIPLEDWNTMEATTNPGEAQHAWKNAQTGISMGVIESFKKYEELDIRRAKEIELCMATAVTRTTRNESRNFNNARRSRFTDSNVAALDTELSELKEELTVARNNGKIQPSPEAVAHMRELESAVVDVETKLKQAKAEAKSSSSGRVRAPRTRPNPVAATSAPTAAVNEADEAHTIALATASSEPPQEAASIASSGFEGSSDADVEVAAPRRVSSWKRAQTEPSDASSKRQKKLEDPLVGWMTEDPETHEQLTGHEWVAPYPEEFAQHYKKDHKRYLEYLEYAAQAHS
ncbi:hypothetical protein C8R45DRAFT_1104288 [Mycena sanguinolenta]|nr:hypothetical protein C8R45DRAFT_1104288 [Mycena sanguinolenta]